MFKSSGCEEIYLKNGKSGKRKCFSAGFKYLITVKKNFENWRDLVKLMNK